MCSIRSVRRPAKIASRASGASRFRARSPLPGSRTRRAVTDQDLAAPLSFYTGARQGGDFESGIQAALPTILASPKFLYRAERSPAGLAPGSIHRISDLDLASRLSFFLQSRMPDDDLLRLAEQKRLSDPTVLSAQVARLLADAKS